MGLYTVLLTFEQEDDAEAKGTAQLLATVAEGYSEVIEFRWFRDEVAEGQAAFAGVEWGGR